MSFLRETLTILAIAVVLALSAALAAPWFINWGSHRGWIEETLSAAAGGQVRVAGDIDVRLLPAPRLDLRQASWSSGQPGAPTIFADQLRLEIAVAPLLQGAVRFVEARFDKPRLVVNLDADGAIALPAAASAPAAIAFERFEARGGRIEITRAGAPLLLLEDVSLDADAASLTGPFRGAGRFVHNGVSGAYRFGANLSDDGRLRAKANVDAGGGWPVADFDGALIAERAGAGVRLRLEGGVAVAGVLPAASAEIPFRASGPLVADAAQARIEPLEFRFGPSERQTTATGAASYAFAPQALAVRLAAPQLDIDRLLPGEGAADPMARLSRLMLSALDGAPRGRAVAFTLEAAAPAVQLGGDTLTEASLRLALPRAGAGRLALSTNLPGRASVSLDGEVESGLAARFVGKASATARDLGRLADWIGRADPDIGGRLRGLPFRTIDASADVTASRVQFSAYNLDLRADRSTFTGSAAFTAPVDDKPARLYADLSSAALDLDGLPDLRGPARALQDADLNLSLDARAVRLARVGGGMVDSGRIRAKVTRTGGVLELERLSVENLGGATLSATGRADPTGGRLAASLEAQRLVELAALARRIAPGPLAEMFAERAVAFSPARLDFSAEAAARDGGLELRTLRVEGSARGSRINATAWPAGDAVELELEARSTDTPIFLRQFGVESAPVSGVPASRITVRAAGSASSGFETVVKGDIAGASLGFSGRVRRAGAGFEAEGRGSVGSKDISPLLQVLALGWPDPHAAAPAEATAGVLAKAGRVEARALSGALAGVRFHGDVQFAPWETGLRRGLTGALDLDRVSLDALSSVILGPSGASRSVLQWSEAPFAPGLADLPPARIELRIGALDLRGGWEARAATARLDLTPGAMTLDNLSARLGASTVAGRVALRRDKAEASLGLRVTFDGPIDLRERMAGRIGATFELAATGRSERALIANLAGAGRVRLSEIVIPKADTQAVDRVVAVVEKDTVAADERTVIPALAREFDRAALSLGEAEFDALVAGGVARLQVARIPAPHADLTLGGAFDLRSGALEQSLDIQSRSPPARWSGEPPRARIVWSGPVEKPLRAVEAAPLVNALSARAIARETVRIEALEADIRERSFFNRRLRADQWSRQREREIAAHVAERERQERIERERQERLERERLERERLERERQERLERERLERERLERQRKEAEQRSPEAQRPQDTPPAIPQSAPGGPAPLPPPFQLPSGVFPSPAPR